MDDLLTVSSAARAVADQTGVDLPPRAISDLFYLRVLDDRRCPIVGGRRLIPRTYLPTIIEVLRDRGYLSLAGEGVLL